MGLCVYSIFVILLSSTLTPSHANTSLWEKIRDKSKALEVYKECRDAAKATTTLCRGIFGPDCINGLYCDHIGVVKETDDAFEYENVNLETMFLGSYLSRDAPKEKNMGYMIAVAPYERVGLNYTAKCKDQIRLQDFKFFAYKGAGERRLSDYHGKEIVAWDSSGPIFGAAPMINKTTWHKTCADRLKETNYIIKSYGGRRVEEHSNVVMVVQNEYMFFLRGDYYDKYTSEEMLMTRDPTRYTSADNVLYANFRNDEPAEHERKYQVPASEFPAPPSSTTFLRASLFSTILTVLLGAL